jgi:hypothetical protein
LEDDWLDRLNGLQSLALISVCEGHCGRRTDSSGRMPHIKLRLKEALMSGVARRWDACKMTVLSEVNRLFQSGDTYLNLELRFKLRSSTGRFSYQEDLIVRVHSRQARVAREMDDGTRDWFLQSVSRIETLDRCLERLWSGVEDDDAGCVPREPQAVRCTDHEVER